MYDGNGLESLLDEVDEILTDSQHPMDPKQSQKVNLMLLRQIVNMQLAIQRDVADMKVNLQNRRAALDERIGKIENEIEAIKKIMVEYPSLTWLLRYKTTPTMRFIVGFLLVLYLLARNYPALAAWWGLPPLP